MKSRHAFPALLILVLLLSNRELPFGLAQDGHAVSPDPPPLVTSSCANQHWNFCTVDSTEDNHLYLDLSMALDAAGIPHMSYLDRTSKADGDLKYARLTSS